MKKILTYAFILLALSSLLYITINHITSSKNNKYNIQHTEPVKEQNQYIIKGYNNRIAIFTNDNTQPDYILDSPFISDLPEYDQKLLANGITAINEAEVRRILEDYDN